MSVLRILALAVLVIGGCATQVARFGIAAERLPQEPVQRLAQVNETPDAETTIINLVCDDVTGAGEAVKTFIFIDMASKYVSYKDLIILWNIKTVYLAKQSQAEWLTS